MGTSGTPAWRASAAPLRMSAPRSISTQARVVSFAVDWMVIAGTKVSRREGGDARKKDVRRRIGDHARPPHEGRLGQGPDARVPAPLPERGDARAGRRAALRRR